MKDSVKIGIGIVIGFCGVCLCILCCLLVFSVGGVTFINTILDITPNPSSSVERTKSPLPIGSEVRYNDLLIKLTKYEFSDSYKTDYDYEETPPEGAKFLWIYLIVRNDGKNSTNSPSSYEFTLIYQNKQIDTDGIYSTRPGYDEFNSGDIFPGISREGWLRFTLPKAAQSNQLTINYKPTQLFDDTYYSWNLSP